MKRLFLLLLLMIPVFAFANDDKSSPVHQGVKIELGIVQAEVAPAVEVNFNLSATFIKQEYNPCQGYPPNTCYCNTVTEQQPDGLTQYRTECSRLGTAGGGGADSYFEVFYVSYSWKRTAQN